MSSTQGALLQAREETTLCSENSGQFPHVFLLREKLKTTSFSSKAGHVRSRELPAGIEVYSVEISAVALSVDHGQVQVALSRSWQGAWGMRRVWFLTGRAVKQISTAGKEHRHV